MVRMGLPGFCVWRAWGRNWEPCTWRMTRALAARVSEGRLYLACIGQFKRGKSTLINALIGEPVLPVGFIPVTAVPTVIRYGARKKARIKFADSSWKDIDASELNQYVSEEHNPENQKVWWARNYLCQARFSPPGCAWLILRGWGRYGQVTRRPRRLLCRTSMLHWWWWARIPPWPARSLLWSRMSGGKSRI